MNSDILFKLHRHIEVLQRQINSAQFYGYDPYDGLSSNNKIIKKLSTSKYYRLIFTHFNKRSPINFRSMLSIDRQINSKSVALFMSSLIKLNKITEAKSVLELLLKTGINSKQTLSWGYYFNWQSRAFYIPRGTPSVVVTGFAANALLDLYEQTNDEKFLKYVLKSINFITKELNLFHDKDGICFSYTPKDNSVIYNASAIGLEVISRYLYLSGKGESDLYDILNRGLNFILNKQNIDGSWPYGMAGNQQFIDHYHTCYILSSLHNIYKYNYDDIRLLSSIKLGLDYYLKNLFITGSIPKYYHNSQYPIESHCCGAAMHALCNLSDEFGDDLIYRAINIADWSIQNLYDKNRHYFYYQKHKFYTNKINYLRWSQSWMLYGFSHLKYKLEVNKNSLN